MDPMSEGTAKASACCVDAIELTLCDSEPIHRPGAIQPHGVLLALEPTELRIMHAGGDTLGLLRRPVQTLLGENVARLFSADHMAQLQALAAAASLPRAVHAFSVAAGSLAATSADVTAFRDGAQLVLEIEPRREQPPDNPLAAVRSMLRSVQQSEATPSFCQAVVDEVRRLIGFDRVMLYRFLNDGSGAVIAEAADAGVESFLGLHYPHSDIPKQARELYRTNWIRAIPDARYEAALILSLPDAPSSAPLDLSQSALRSVSPIHRQYLANMGVVASMSMSIIIRGQLWGLIACHHREPRYLPHGLREACELFAEMVSSQLEARLAAESFAIQKRSAAVHEELLNRLSQESELAAGLIRYRPNLLDLVPASGVALWIDGEFTNIEATPDRDEIEAIVGWLNATVKDGVFQTDRLPLIYPPAERFAAVASGLLALSVSKNPRDYVLWFRPELVRTVNWAGKPTKGGQGASDRQMLTPRTSFAMWQELVRLHASPWLEGEVEAAHRLRVALLEVVLRRIDQLAREREVARQGQERLTRELNARLLQSERLAEALKKESELRAAVEGDLTQVLRRTVSDQETERQRIARELHDTLGQSLTMLQLGLQAIGHDIADHDRLQQRLDGINKIAVSLGRDVHRIATEIRPSSIDDLGIQKAIESLLETWSDNAALNYYLHLAPKDLRLPKVIEATLYRVLQETLTNVVRHAEARKVGVILNVTDVEASMIVEDDGRGFPADEAGSPAMRLGLLGIRERLALVGGSLEIESSPGRGTTVFARIPLQADDP
ncbi:Bacteriophytochrome [Bradyrhizobium sp. ORS 375]|uniref:GAF domain-containing protein n=1 Tax=Bradyrhizobium sp. (strain ORS 375) TaxID=566679 RepID=UPI0002409141|nr:GAF domain-containing protein [Bradyrhizobium sp. ORS 375]CCD96589.1 Bacteriophytochrome [Bradyrhizobium sp. ORS 375]